MEGVPAAGCLLKSFTPRANGESAPFTSFVSLEPAGHLRTLPSDASTSALHFWLPRGITFDAGFSPALVKRSMWIVCCPPPPALHGVKHLPTASVVIGDSVRFHSRKPS